MFVEVLTHCICVCHDTNQYHTCRSTYTDSNAIRAHELRIQNYEPRQVFCQSFIIDCNLSNEWLLHTAAHGF